MNKETDISKLMNKIKNKEFNSTEELSSFMNDLIGGNAPTSPKSKNKKYLAQDLVYEAYEQPLTKAKKTIKKALQLDPNNADAYSYLASQEKDIDKAIELYEKAVIAGEKTLGPDFFEEEKGCFWGMTESRPYMRAKAGLASCFILVDQTEKAIEIYEEMLELNPNDNQGIRYMLSTLYLRKNLFKAFYALNKQYDEYGNAVSNFNLALAQFKQEGKSNKSNKLLLEAHTKNHFVIDLLLGNKKMPKQQPEYIGIGDKNEAVSYVFGNYQIWDETPDAFEWLYYFLKNRVQMN